MENSGKALLIAGAIIIAILLVAIGVFVYGKSANSATSSMTSMNTRELEAFNSKFIPYEGEKKGTNFKDMVSVLIAHSSTYSDEVDKIPSITFTNSKISANGAKVKNIERPKKNNDTGDYVSALSSLRNAIEESHVYTIELVLGASGIVEEIKITY